MSIAVFENDRQGPGPCSACGTNGAHYCPADLCGPDRTDCEWCGEPEMDEDTRICELCHEDMVASRAVQAREAQRDAFEGHCDDLRAERKEEG